MRVPFLLLGLLALVLAGCGQAESTVEPKDKAQVLASGAPEAPPPRPEPPPPPPKRTGSLEPRAGDTPLEAGALVPAFEARPDKKAIILFYRGYW